MADSPPDSPLLLDQATPSAPLGAAGVAAAPAPLTSVELGVIDLFVAAVRLLGLPKSIGEIYGLLFISPEPVSLHDITGRLSISKGSASQGLRFLRNLGAVSQTYVPGDRRDYYVCQAELKKLAGGFIKEELRPNLEGGTARLNALADLAKSEGGDQAKFYQERVRRLRNWHARASKLMRLMQAFLGESAN
ncbi:MAG: hypothetical protein R3F11_07970 [Verrucomicrobiales bacterium]